MRQILTAILILIVSGIMGCTNCRRLPECGCMECTEPMAGDALPSGDLIWLTNTSAVNFNNLDELNCGRSELLELRRFEGFFEKAVTTRLQYKFEDGCCLSPEAEWVIWFPEPEQLKEALDGSLEWHKINAILTGMIEGKRMDILNLSAARPDWRTCSGSNNVVAYDPKMKAHTLGELEDFIVNAKGNEWKISICYGYGSSNNSLYYSELSDLQTAYFKCLGNNAFERITKTVARHFYSHKPTDTKSTLTAINLGAQGKHACYFNKPMNRLEAILRSPFKHHKLGKDAERPNSVMFRMTEKAVNRMDDVAVCLPHGGKYIVKLMADHKEIVRAEMILK